MLYKHLYLTTLDNSIVEMMKSHLGEKVRPRSEQLHLLLPPVSPLLEMKTAQPRKSEKVYGNSKGNRYPSLPKYSKSVPMN